MSETDSSGEKHQQGEDSAKDDLDAMDCGKEIQHTVTFKCIGATRDVHGQETLHSVSQLLAKGKIVPVNQSVP